MATRAASREFGIDVSLRGSGALEPSFEEFVVENSTALLRTAYLLTGDRGHAEDLLQTTLLRTAWRWSVASQCPEAYARRVLINLSRDRWRNLRRRVVEYVTPEIEANAVRDPSDAVVDRIRLVPALQQLPRRQREVIALRFLADLSVADTAAALGCSEGTVKSYTQRALARLRELLEAQSSSEVPNAR